MIACPEWTRNSSKPPGGRSNGRWTPAARTSAVELLGPPDKSQSGRHEPPLGQHRQDHPDPHRLPSGASSSDFKSGDTGDMIDLAQYANSALTSRRPANGCANFSAPARSGSITNGQPSRTVSVALRERIRDAMNRFRESKPIEGTLAVVYFEKRGLDVPNGLSGDTLRYHRNMPFLRKKGVSCGRSRCRLLAEGDARRRSDRTSQNRAHADWRKCAAPIRQEAETQQRLW